MKYLFTSLATIVLFLSFTLYAGKCYSQYNSTYDEKGVKSVPQRAYEEAKLRQNKIQNDKYVPPVNTSSPSTVVSPRVKQTPKTAAEEAVSAKEMAAFKKYSYVAPVADENGLKLVKVPANGSYGPYFGYCDSNYVEVIEAGYYKILPPSEGYYALKNGSVFGWGFIDKHGKLAVPFKYGEVLSTFQNGRARVATNSGRAIWIDYKGNRIYDPTDLTDEELKLKAFNDRLASYESIAPYPDENGLRRVSMRRGYNSVYGYLDSTNTEVILTINNDYKEPSEGLYALKEYHFWGFRDKNDTKIIDFRYDQVLNTFYNGMARVVGANRGDTIWIDKNGNNISNEDYKTRSDIEIKERLSRYSFIAATEDENGLRLVKAGDKYGYLNHSNSEFIRAVYIDYKAPTQGSYALKDSVTNKWGFVYKNGNQFLEYIYDDVLQNFENSMAKVVLDGRTIWIDFQGKESKVKTQ